MPIRVDDMPAAHPLRGSDKLLVDQGDQDPSFGTGKVSLDLVEAFIGAASGRDDLETAAGWVTTASNNGSTKAMASGTPDGFPSIGIVNVVANVTGGRNRSNGSHENRAKTNGTGLQKSGPHILACGSNPVCKIHKHDRILFYQTHQEKQSNEAVNIDRLAKGE
jgi:hypothetical protein